MDLTGTAFRDMGRDFFEAGGQVFSADWETQELFVHGDDDRNVPFGESVDLAYHLSRLGVYFEELAFPDEVHGFLLHANWVAAYRAADDFFQRMLWENQAPEHTRGRR